MNKIAIFIVLIICLFSIGYYYIYSKTTLRSPLSQVLKNTSFHTPKKLVVQKKSESLFVPYWGFVAKDIDTDGYDSVIYFGISANEQGIDTTDIGYKKLEQFTQLVPSDKEKLLTIRMTDSTVNSKVLDDKKTQEKIIQDAINLAKKNNFSGTVFDFEINALAFPSVVSNITSFYQSFYEQAKRNDLSFQITMYGDTFYRARPYDVEKIAASADKVYVMTYDFHKSRGNPGPNFPLSGKNIYGYDIASMLDDFSETMPAEKLIIVFGLFGYDWEVNKKNESVKNGVPMSFLEIKKQFLDMCSEKNCQVNKDTISQETKLTYRNNEEKSHIIWFEDPKSVEKKKAFLVTKGIHAIAFWAYSYY